MTKRPKPDAPIAAEPWFVDLINRAHTAAVARQRETAVATKIEAEAWATLAHYCAGASSRQ
jgi:hypothetical protein